MTTNNKKGFTIIEVVLVLAIAGLIFLMVFIALPSLQRTQRNTQREDDLARVITAITDYQTNNSGKLPFRVESSANKTDAKFVTRYIDSTCGDIAANGTVANCTGDQFRDPDGTNYEFAYKGNATAAGNASVGTELDHKIVVYTKASCGDTEGTYKLGTGDRDFALFFVEEGGAIYCNDNK